MRRSILIGIIALLVGVLASLFHKYRQPLNRIWKEQKAMRHTIVADSVFIERPPAEYEASLLARRAEDFNLMVHGRRTAGSPRRIVIVAAGWLERWKKHAHPDVQPDASAIYAAVLSTSTLKQPGRPVGFGELEHEYFDAVPIGSLRFYAGQPDRDDESHFTVDYETPEGRGTIDGWLMPDDTVKFRFRHGPATRPIPN